MYLGLGSWAPALCPPLCLRELDCTVVCTVTPLDDLLYCVVANRDRMNKNALKALSDVALSARGHTLSQLTEGTSKQGVEGSSPSGRTTLSVGYNPLNLNSCSIVFKTPTNFWSKASTAAFTLDGIP